jgi:hypothetical protein
MRLLPTDTTTIIIITIIIIIIIIVIVMLPVKSSLCYRLSHSNMRVASRGWRRVLSVLRASRSMHVSVVLWSE